ncbi:MAG TPA: hypothetical protein VMR18_04320 [Candidatus Saccharimonadales bacterium]|nr:hypothetical protein [Candidatus Saccharimonadales bacterium]
MALKRKTIFLKAWLCSIVGGASLTIFFYLLTDVVHVFQNLNSLSDFTNIFISISVVGNAVGAGVLIWRVADKYYHAHVGQILVSYFFLSLLNVAVAIGILFINTPLTILIAFWNLLAPLCVIKILYSKKTLAWKQ